jgi:hypothetical protein
LAVTGGAAFGGAGVGAAVVPIVGLAAKQGAASMTRRAADRAAATIANGGVMPVIPGNLLAGAAPLPGMGNALSDQ